MANRWGNSENSVRLYFWGSKITAEGDCSHEIKRRLLLGRKVMTNLDSILKKQRRCFANKGPSSPDYSFSSSHVWVWDWTVKKAEHWRIDAFELWYWRRLLSVPWTARRSNQSILKEISPGISLEGMMLKLKLQYFGHLMRRVDSLEKTVMLERLGAGEVDDKGWYSWMASPTWWIWIWLNPELVIDMEALHAVIHGAAKSRTWLIDCT